ARRFSSKVRNRTRKALRTGVEVERDDTGRLLPEVHRLYHQSVPRWAAQDRLAAPLAGYARLRARLREPAAKYAAVGAHLGHRCVVWLARVDGRPAATIVVLYQGATANYWRGAMDKPLAGPVAANDLLHRLAIEEACRRGCRRYSMGETAPGSSLARFKESFGAVPIPAVDLALGPP
ncbi:MAG TPA: GNAT family N-acetyltransferase, partial [Pseudonocardiaceae bacterium]